MKRVAILGCLLLFAGCVPSGALPRQPGYDPDFGSYPTNYIDIAYSWIQSNFGPPSSFRDLTINLPVQTEFQPLSLMGPRETKCYRVDITLTPTDSFGRALRSESYSIFVRDGIVLNPNRPGGNQ